MGFDGNSHRDTRGIYSWNKGGPNGQKYRVALRYRDRGVVTIGYFYTLSEAITARDAALAERQRNQS